jgi:hypothetical protein
MYFWMPITVKTYVVVCTVIPLHDAVAHLRLGADS